MIDVSWTGADGSVWDLRSGPVLLVDEAAEGFGDPAWTRPVQSTPGRDGQRRTNSRSTAAAREGFLPADLLPQGGDVAWLTLSRAWWRSWHPDRPGILTVTAPDGSARTVTAYLDDDNGYAPGLDPSGDTGERVDVSWVADDPWWRGPVVSTSIGLANDLGDFLQGGTAPGFLISPSNTAGATTLANPGDVDAWPTYVLSGGTASFSITVAGATVAGAVAVPTGGTLTIDGALQVALLDDGAGHVSNVTPRLSSVGFAPIPDGAAVAVTTSLTGSPGASLTVQFAPRYRRAW